MVARDRVIIGGAVNDNVRANEPSGVIRAYDVYTGKLLWNWDPATPTRPRPSLPGRPTAPAARTAGAFPARTRRWGWSTFRSATVPDQWGGRRSENSERFSSSIVALDLDSGQLRWVFQTVRHDLWDMDVPAQPSLIDIQTEEGRCRRWWRRPSRATSMCWTAAPASRSCRCGGARATGAAEGDWVARTQPASALSYEPPKLQGKDLWGATLIDQMMCHIQFHSLRYEGRYTPPSTQGTLVHPGNFGVFNWGGWRSIRYARWYSAHRRTGLHFAADPA